MTIYLSKSSVFVKIATISTLIILILVALTLMTTANNYGVIGGTVLSILIIGTVIYFYSNSLDKIILNKAALILKKNFGQIIVIPRNDIIDIQKLEFSNLPMTYGSQGIFGFLGNTMDDSVSLVKDRRNMIRITTKNNKYIVSAEESDKLVSEIKTLYNIISNEI